jgi:beta-glucanase (GH16 family)
MKAAPLRDEQRVDAARGTRAAPDDDMAIAKAGIGHGNADSVMRVTRDSRRNGALGCGALLLVVAAGCEGASAPDDAWTARPDEVSSISSTSDAGADADELPPEPPPPPLCVLSGPPSSAPGEVLVFSEEFDGELDPVKWNIGNGYKGHDAISNTASPANAVPRDGALEITTERNASDAVHPYVSGYIDMLGRYARTYGKVEIRARFPFAQGVWYALWGRPWFQSFPEIDIEIVNRPTEATTQVYFVNHWAAPPLPADDRRSYVSFKQDVSEFHTYTLLWKPGSLEWQLDGVTKMTALPQGVPDQPVYWILNGWVGGWVGDPTATTPFPNTFAVDYLRVYRLDGLVADPQIKVIYPRAKYARKDSIEVAIANFDEACTHVSMYDGDRLTRTTSTRPFKFAMSALSRGAHTLTYVATDGARRTSATVDVQID